MDEAPGEAPASVPEGEGDPGAPERTSGAAEGPSEAEPYLERRLALGALDYGIPEAARRWPYYLGGLTAFLLVVLVVTGVYLAQFYHPDPLGAHDSVLYIITRAPLGDWMRSLHVWASSAVTVTIAAHLAWVFWRRSYRPPREMTWWAGVVLAGLVFMLLVTGTVLRWDQEGFEALAHLTAGGEMTGALGLFFTEGFTRSTSLLSRVFSLHTSLLPLAVAAVMGLHFWLIRHLGLHASGPRNTRFREHATRLAGFGLVVFAALGLLAALAPEGLGYPPVSGVEVTKPFWPLLWVYGLENLIGMRGMVVGPAVLFTFLLCVPFLDRGPGDEPGRHGWVGWLGAVLGLALLALWIYAVVAPRQQHLGM